MLLNKDLELIITQGMKLDHACTKCWVKLLVLVSSKAGYQGKPLV